MDQRRVYEILEPAKAGDVESKFFDICLMALLIFGSAMAILATVEEIASRYEYLLLALKALLVLVFTQEYALRL